MIYKLPGCLPHLFTTVLTVLKTGDWRTRRLSDWCIAGKFAEKSQTGYVGIDNAGCICYMTSFFQQMYMIPSLRQAIFEAEDPQFNPATKQNNILYQLKVLFASLQYGEEESFDPRDFCESFKDHSGNPINIYEQMDVDEFTNILFDRLENQLKGGHNFINEHFGGVMANEIICRGCPHSSEKEEPFLSISLEVKNKRDIYQSLEALVKG
jgi:ubiquitin C-terminal hydrolase